MAPFPLALFPVFLYSVPTGGVAFLFLAPWIVIDVDGQPCFLIAVSLDGHPFQFAIWCSAVDVAAPPVGIVAVLLVRLSCPDEEGTES